ncbi:MAG: glycogen debranching enzyme family protein [Prolixibacteraceae bacterium]|nr:glycogen debranching enzyme family protein [Prolixibacteraceae bacterium]
MSYLNFDKGQLVNLEYSLDKEILRSNRAGSYTSTTLIGCNTRKYHGLLITPIKEFNNEKHVLLSSLDVSVVQRNSEFNLGIHRFQGGYYEPNGHKYIRDIEIEKIPKITYRVGDVILSMERILIEEEQQVIIKYTLEDAHSPTVLRLRPFLAFRGIHNLSKANLYVNRRYINIGNGIKIRLYEGYPYLHMQLNKKCDFIPVPDWYYNIEYIKEKSRGYEYLEDLYVPGYFEVQVKKGESILFSGSLFAENTRFMKKHFKDELAKRNTRFDFLSFLKNASEQFIFKKGNDTDIIAGFPWYGSITRQSFIALPGLVDATGNAELYPKVLKTYCKYLKDGLFPGSIENKSPVYNSTDTPLWFIWALQQLYKTSGNGKSVWKEYGKPIKSILNSYKKGLSFNNKMLANALIYAGKEGVALTWMDSYSNGLPVVQRKGMAVEINALWYNAVVFATELAEQANDHHFLMEWEGITEKIKDSFLESFWKEEAGYLADYIDGDYIDMSVRPNMVIATALDFSPLKREQKKHILSVCRNQLLTPRGLRTLSPENPKYKGVIEGNQEEREKCAHQGAVYPWLIRFFVEGYLKVHSRGGVHFIKKLMESFEDELSEHCIGTLSEAYNGNPPHRAKGAVSQAWNVASVVSAYKMVQEYEN